MTVRSFRLKIQADFDMELFFDGSIGNGNEKGMWGWLVETSRCFSDIQMRKMCLLTTETTTKEETKRLQDQALDDFLILKTVRATEMILEQERFHLSAVNR